MALKSRKTLWNSISHTVATATKTYKLKWFIHTDNTSERNKFNPTAGNEMDCTIRKLYSSLPHETPPGLNVISVSTEPREDSSPCVTHAHARGWGSHRALNLALQPLGILGQQSQALGCILSHGPYACFPIGASSSLPHRAHRFVHAHTPKSWDEHHSKVKTFIEP